MKKSELGKEMRSLIFRIGFGLLVTLATFHAPAAKTLKLAYSDVESYHSKWVPVKRWRPPGFALDVINRVSSMLGIDVEYVRLPGKRVLQEIASGNVDGGFVFSFNPNRAKLARYPMKDGALVKEQRIANIGYYFYTLKDSGVKWDGVKLDNFDQKIGAHLGFSIVNELKNKQLKVHEVKTTEQLFTMLTLQRLSAIAVQDTTANQFMRDERISGVEQLKPAVTIKEYYLVFSHQFFDSSPSSPTKYGKRLRVRDETFAKQGSQYLN
ncbi:transporter substrate-binding domain-containing protein [Vibrio ostreicida]|uniref:Transporter substrate-binding domain-containing protein n=1 Tax=Vibrio ostreicida TaxID=526588 RepID=A0ABT8C3E7_9VIBR|nr:transporter substrate-binding domain-containing protein [Vibrio ostreicida]MDN3612740.1 transporter substrate-binding domain-containing protein [Vibrio ostreicida]